MYYLATNDLNKLGLNQKNNENNLSAIAITRTWKISCSGLDCS